MAEDRASRSVIVITAPCGVAGSVLNYRQMSVTINCDEVQYYLHTLTWKLSRTARV